MIDSTEQRFGPEIEQDVAALRLGDKIRNLRHRRNLTLKGVAELTGLSKSLLSQIENEFTVPPIVTLARIAKALGVTLGYFFETTRTERRISFVPANQRGEVIGLPHNRPHRVGYRYQALTRPIANQHMEPFWVELQPRQTDELVYFNHPGEEFIFIQEGSLEFHGGEQTFILNTGDSLYFDANIPHAVRSLGNRKAKALAVLYSSDS